MKMPSPDEFCSDTAYQNAYDDYIGACEMQKDSLRDDEIMERGLNEENNTEYNQVVQESK